MCCATTHSFFCAFLAFPFHLQLITQAMPHEIEEDIVPGKGMKQKDLHDDDGLKPRNNYTLEEKIDMSLIMAESLADLHGFRDGVM
jgi:hypothetical protein